jgi:nitrogen regulatory protein P-II 2
MDTHARKLIVIITEAILEKPLVEDVKRLGALGYTVYDVRGGGQGGERAGAWDADRNIEMKVIATEAVAEAISRHVLETYCANYSVTVFLADVAVLRPEKFP